MKISRLLTDDAVLSELGQRISHRRLELQYTQADAAEQAGIAKRTLERIEAGASAQLSTFIRILRTLDLLADLDRIIPEVEAGPMDLLKQQGKKRLRASSRPYPRQSDPPSWTWHDKT